MKPQNKKFLKIEKQTIKKLNDNILKNIIGAGEYPTETISFTSVACISVRPDLCPLIPDMEN